MVTSWSGGRHAVGLGAAIICGAVLAGCAGGPPEPAPVIMRGAEAGYSPAATPAPYHPPRTALAGPRGEGRQIVVRPGQSLGGIAHQYHVSEHALVAANHLHPPYKIEAGQHLVIPVGGEPPLHEANAVAPPLPASPPARPPGRTDQRIEHTPDIIPLDGPPPRHVAAPPAPRDEPSAAQEARAEAGPEPAVHHERFGWPVHGRIVEGYGKAPGGTRNDGINIAAPQGTPVKAIDDGTVAYAGNELRGYGTLVLIKHSGGWISAYAHCEDLHVKKGDRVNRGQVIAKVGATGGVSQPQLHFELRRGKEPVDPREFLGTAPSAATGADSRAG